MFAKGTKIVYGNTGVCEVVDYATPNLPGIPRGTRYYVLRFGFPPAKIYRLARTAFAGKYEPEVLLAWLKNFYRRFYQQQFKRSCLPDGPKVGSVTLSPRGDWRMPSDACASAWQAELDTLSAEG